MKILSMDIMYWEYGFMSKNKETEDKMISVKSDKLHFGS
jgi:hypothetical protein